MKHAGSGVGRATTFAAAVAAVCLLALWDLGRMVVRGTGAASPLAHATMALTAVAIGTVVLVLPVLARAELARLVHGRARPWHFGAGFADGAALAVVWINRELLRPMSLAELVTLLSFGAVALGLVRAALVKRPRLARGLTVAALLVAALAAELLPWKFMFWTRLGFDLIAVTALASLLARVPAIGSRQTVRAALVLSVLAVVATEPLLRSSADARWLLHERSSHARSWGRPLVGLADLDGDGASNVLGGRDCDEARANVGPGRSEVAGDGVDQNCLGGDGTARTDETRAAASGLARGADVLVLSIDSLRWDLVGELPRTRAALGPHVSMDRAVSPSSRTIDALSALVRGRSARGIRMGGGPSASVEMPAHDPHPTLGSILTEAGYRAVTVPTHRYLDGRSSIFAGFEVLEPESFDRVVRAPYGIGRPKPIVPGPDALERMLEAARETERPLVAWVHVMETHSPYRWSATGHGPGTLEALRRSIRHVDAMVAEGIERWRRIRGRPAIIAVFGDHGEEFHEHGGRYHGSSAYAEQVRVAWLLSAPGLPSTELRSPVSTGSLTPTVLDLLGVPAPATVRKPSLVGCALGSAPCPDLAVSEIRSRNRISVSYTGPRWRLVHDPVHDLAELFDSHRDPLDQEDLSAARPAVTADMLARARAWAEEH